MLINAIFLIIIFVSAYLIVMSIIKIYDFEKASKLFMLEIAEKDKEIKEYLEQSRMLLDDIIKEYEKTK